MVTLAASSTVHWGPVAPELEAMVPMEEREVKDQETEVSF